MKGDQSAENLGEDLGHVVARKRLRPSRPVRLSGVAGREHRDLGGDGGHVPHIDVPDLAVAGRSAKAAGLGYPCRHHQKVLHVSVVAQKGVGESRGDQGVFDLALDAAAGDRRVRVSLLGDLDDVLDTARSALSITLSSWERTAWVTRITLKTPRIAWSMLSGESRSPRKTSTPGWARSAAFSGWRANNRTGTRALRVGLLMPNRLCRP